MNLKVEYPPSYQHLVWNFKQSNNDAIKRSVDLFSTHKNVHKQVVIFNKILMNIFSNHIPNTHIVCVCVCVCGGGGEGEGGLNLLPNFQKKGGGLDRRVAGKQGVTFFKGVAIFTKK